MDVKFDIAKVKWFKDIYGNPSAYYQLKVPGVTTVIGDMVEDPEWDEFVKEVGEEKAKQILEAAGQRGKAMHCYIENFVNELHSSGDPIKALSHSQSVSYPILEKEGIPSDKIEKGREMFFNFYYSGYSNSFTDLIGTEVAVYSPFLFYRGKVDVIYNKAEVGKVITDFKTSSSYIERGSMKEKKYKLQLGGYALAVEHMYKFKGNLKIDRSSILVLQTKTDVIQEIACDGEELERQKKEFETLVRSWHIKNNQNFLFDDTDR